MRVWCARFRVQGLVCRVEGAGWKVQGFRTADLVLTRICLSKPRERERERERERRGERERGRPGQQRCP